MKPKFFDLSTKNIALTIVFASFYTVFFFWNLFPLVGGQGRFIQVGTLIAPLIGIVIGPMLSVFGITIGGAIGAFISQSGPFGPLSFVPHLAAALCAGLLYNNKRWYCSFTYLLLLLALAFYPVVGPAWLWPPFLWLHIIVLVFLFSPLQPKIGKYMLENKSASKFVFAVASTLFVATLFSHVVGSLMYEAIYWPTFISEMEIWRANWQLLSWIYPVERLVIAVVSTPLAVGLLKALRIHGFRVDS
ncbi:MAG: hypothetical protein ACLFU9_06680 [Candidatus Bathyarchaeia archaeon]